MIRKKVAFVCYGGGHVNMVVPVIHRLKKNHAISCLALTTAKSILDSEGIESTGFKDLVHERDENAIKIGKSLFEDLPESTVAAEESIAYLGLSYGDLVNRIGAIKAKKLYSVKGRASFLPIAILERYLLREKPDLLVTTISPRAEEAAIYAARKLSIPSICLVDLFARPSICRASQRHYGDLVCVISDEVKQLMVKNGRSADEIYITGNPAFDLLFDSAIDEKARAFRIQKGWADKKVILWASQIEPERSPFNNKVGDPFLPEKIENHLKWLVENKLGWHLVIRPHPNENKEREDCGASIELCDSADQLNILLRAVDVVVIMTSTVGLEARLMGTPVVSVDLSVFSNDTPYSALKLSKGIKSLSEMEKALYESFENPDSATEGVKMPAIGGATNRIVKVIENKLYNSMPTALG